MKSSLENKKSDITNFFIEPPVRVRTILRHGVFEGIKKWEQTTLATPGDNKEISLVESIIFQAPEDLNGLTIFFAKVFTYASEALKAINTTPINSDIFLPIETATWATIRELCDIRNLMASYSANLLKKKNLIKLVVVTL